MRRLKTGTWRRRASVTFETEIERYVKLIQCDTMSFDNDYGSRRLVSFQSRDMETSMVSALR